MPKVKLPVPHHIVTEFLGGIAFCKNQEDEVRIAEQIAGQEYESMEHLINVCRGSLGHPYNLRVKDLNKYAEECKTNPYFEKYFYSYEPLYVVYDKDGDDAEDALLISGTKQEILDSIWDDFLNNGEFGGFYMATKEHFDTIKWD